MKITRKPYSITRQLIVYVVLFRSFITLLITAFQLYQEYHHGVSHVRGQIVQIEQLSLSSVTENLWNLYEKQIRVQLRDLIQLPDVQYMEIESSGEVIASAGIRTSQNTIIESLPLIYHRQDEEIPIGKLIVVATLDGVYEELFDRVVVILISNGIKTALVSLFIFLIFQFLVTRHLSSISGHLRNLTADHLDRKLTLDRSPVEDELSQLATSINNMADNLSRTTVTKNYVDNIIASMADGLIVIAPDTTIRLANNTAQDILEYEEQELTSKSIIDIFEDGQKIFQVNAIEKSEDSGAIRRLEANCMSKYGNRIPVLVSVSSMRDRNNEIQGSVYIVHDITERKCAEQALLESEQRFRAIFENALDGILLADATNQQFVDGNATICRMLGYESKELLQLGVKDVHPEEKTVLRPHTIRETTTERDHAGRRHSDVKERRQRFHHRYLCCTFRFKWKILFSWCDTGHHRTQAGRARTDKERKDPSPSSKYCPYGKLGA